MKYGLIGEHLCHSFSREIHDSIGEYSYELLELAPEGVEGFLKSREFCAINVTIPYKEMVIAELDWVSPEVKNIGACNTIINKDGRLFGYNTDYSGMKAMLQRASIEICGRKVLVLGTGGTSRTAVALVKNLGATEVKRASRRNGDESDVICYDSLASEYSDIQVIINTTPCGMFPKTEFTPVDLKIFDRLEGVADVIYNPLRSRLLQDAAARGLKTVGGLYMLVAQAVFANALFMNHEVSNILIDRIFNELLAVKENICLIGMPSCGKTTVGEALADKLGRPFFDSDRCIAEKAGMPAAEYIHRNGIAAFRQVEKETLAELAKKDCCVIATGGGAVLDGENVRNLKQKGRLFFLDVSLCNLTPTSDRPLSKDIAALEALYNERYPIYCGACDTKIDGNGTCAEIVERINKLLK